ncbi:MAG TPA: class I SAM-dependent methyltransferase [Terrimesophilobacter sp.]|nr:class I SAM-dependent methyltransferase [Terrimesophilobacter sp.]
MTDKATEWKYAEQLIGEPDHITAARTHSLELGVDSVSPGVGAALAFIAGATGASNIMELGTGCGVSALWMLHGAPHATLTSIDTEVDHQQAARTALIGAGVPSSRIRLIAGRAREVLPRMNEGAYDLMLIDADAAGATAYLEHGLTLVRPGGVILIAHALWQGRVADPTKRDATTVTYRTLLTDIAASGITASLTPLGDGLLQVLRPTD